MAAQSAPPDDDKDTEESGGFFRRILGVFSTNDEVTEAEHEHPAQAYGVPGMGNLRHMAVEDVAIPKAEIVSVPNTISKEDLVHVFRDSGMSRLPVYEGTLDSPIGMLHLKDFALKHGFNGDTEEFKLEDMLRPLLFVPPSMPIGPCQDPAGGFRGRNRHLADRGGRDRRGRDRHAGRTGFHAAGPGACTRRGDRASRRAGDRGDGGRSAPHQARARASARGKE